MTPEPPTTAVPSQMDLSSCRDRLPWSWWTQMLSFPAGGGASPCVCCHCWDSGTADSTWVSLKCAHWMMCSHPGLWSQPAGCTCVSCASPGRQPGLCASPRGVPAPTQPGAASAQVRGLRPGHLSASLLLQPLTPGFWDPSQAAGEGTGGRAGWDPGSPLLLTRKRPLGPGSLRGCRLSLGQCGAESVVASSLREGRRAFKWGVG